MLEAHSALSSTAEFSERHKLRVLLLLWGTFFGLMLVLEVQEHWAHPGIRWWEPFVWMGTSAAVATLWLWGHWRDRKEAAQYLDQPLRWFWRHLRWFPLIAVVFVCLTYGLRHGIYALVGREYRHEPWLFVLLNESLQLWLFLGLWLGILFALDSFSHWQTQQRRLAELQKSIAQAQLLQLKAQLRPHFLFNALNTISSIMQVDIVRADRLLNQLADLLRATLRADQQELTTLAAELELLRLYARIMEQRFEDRVTVEWNVEAQVESAILPTMILQPLLENAFKHGVENSGVPVSITISARREGHRLALSITNVGEVRPVVGEGVGLSNCRSRLQLHYGEAGILEFTSDTQQAAVRVLIPWKQHTA
jgi:two-component system, LytTR family, sensor kinase